MRFVAMPLLLTAPLCRRKSSLCFAVAPLSTAAASLLISSPFAFRREAAPGRCFSPLLYALPLPRLALRYSALAFPSISIHCLSCSVHFCATTLHFYTFPLQFSAFLGVSLPLRCVAMPCLCLSNLSAANPCVTTPSPVRAFLCNAFALLMISYDFVAIPLLICALHRLRRPQLYFAAACRRNTMQRLCTAQLIYAMPSPFAAFPIISRGYGCLAYTASICAL